jgi:methylglutaconyl-CoA hydratase
MKRQGASTQEANLADARKLAALFRAISRCATPTIARVQGAALGGGLGLAAACDICIASTKAQFATSEVRLGIIPAAIGPYVVRAIGERQAYRYFQTAERINAERAREIGLVHEVVAAGRLDLAVEHHVQVFLKAAPSAVARTKRLLSEVYGRRPADVMALTVEAIATQRVSPEGQEGLKAFLEKRAPKWAQQRR